MRELVMEQRAQIAFVIYIHFESCVSPDENRSTGPFGFVAVFRETIRSKMRREKRGRRAQDCVCACAIARRDRHCSWRDEFCSEKFVNVGRLHERKIERQPQQRCHSAFRAKTRSEVDRCTLGDLIFFAQNFPAVLRSYLYRGFVVSDDKYFSRALNAAQCAYGIFEHRVSQRESFFLRQHSDKPLLCVAQIFYRQEQRAKFSTCGCATFAERLQGCKSVFSFRHGLAG